MVFGRRNEEDRERPNPFITPPPVKNAEDNAIAVDPTRAKTPIMLPQFRAAPESLAGGLEQIKALEPSFDEKQFLQGARAAFTTVVEDFSKGDLTRCTSFLGPQVLPHFRDAIVARHTAGQEMEIKLVRLKDAEVAAAKAEGTQAIITVRFVSDQENILRNTNGKVIGGEEGKVEEITDLWTFARDTKSSDPNWILVETKS
jgi:predicted lipid-binding transport protein (Tim44 family)